MARYQLKVHSEDQAIHYVVPIHEFTSEIDQKKTHKNELYTIDHFILSHKGSFADAKGLLEYLKQYNYYVTDDMTPYISYQNEKKEQVLEVIYHGDAQLDYFIDLFRFLSEHKFNKEEKKSVIYRDPEWKKFIKDVENRILDNDFYDFLQQNLYYIKPYAYNYIATIRNNAKWTRQDEREAYYDAQSGLHEIYTSYKQIRGMKLAIKAYEDMQIRQAYQGEKVVLGEDFVTEPFYSGDEIVDSYIGKQFGPDYNEELLKLYSLDELANLPDEIKEQIHIDGMSR